MAGSGVMVTKRPPEGIVPEVLDVALDSDPVAPGTVAVSSDVEALAKLADAT